MGRIEATSTEMRLLLLSFFLLLPTSSAKAGALEVLGGELVSTIQPDDGFVDDVFAFDAGGRRLAWLRSTATGTTEIHVRDLVQQAELQYGTLKGIPQGLSAMQFVLDGNHLVWFKRGDKTRGGLMDANGRTIRRFAAASELSVTTVGGEEFLSTYRSAQGKDGSERHSLELASLLTGKRKGKATTLAVNSRGVNPVLGFRLSHFKDGHRVAVGVKSGSWDPTTKIRSLDSYAEYSLPERAFIKRLEIEDLKAHREFLSVRQNGPALDQFLFARGSELVLAGDKISPVALAEPFEHYNAKTLSMRELADGSIVFAVQIDPVHPAAAAAKRAAKKWTDFYFLPAGELVAKRLARVFAAGNERLVWQGTGEYLAILDGHVGFERGGPRLRVYQVGHGAL